MYLLNILSISSLECRFLDARTCFAQNQVQILHVTSNNEVPLELQNPDMLLQRGATQLFFPFSVWCHPYNQFLKLRSSYCQLLMYLCNVLSSLSSQEEKGPPKYVDRVQQHRKKTLSLKGIAVQFKFQFKKKQNHTLSICVYTHLDL